MPNLGLRRRITAQWMGSTQPEHCWTCLGYRPGDREREGHPDIGTRLGREGLWVKEAQVKTCPACGGTCIVNACTLSPPPTVLWGSPAPSSPRRLCRVSSRYQLGMCALVVSACTTSARSGAERIRRGWIYVIPGIAQWSGFSCVLDNWSGSLTAHCACTRVARPFERRVLALGPVRDRRSPGPAGEGRRERGRSRWASWGEREWDMHVSAVPLFG
jgi:hypothetical protein